MRSQNIYLLTLLAMVVGGLLLISALTLATMRLGWWNPSYEKVRAQQADPPSYFIAVDGDQMHVRDEGHGPTLLMLHSSMTNLREWDNWAERLKRHYRVVRIDWPPYGLTTSSRQSTGLPGLVKLLEDFAVQQKLGQVTLIGSSSGATLAVLYAAAHPESVRALALSTLPLAAPPATKFSIQEEVMQWLHEKIVPNYYPKFYYQTTLRELYGKPALLKQDTIEWYYETNTIPGGFRRVTEYLKANRKGLWKSGAGREASMIHVPVLLQWGDRDPVLNATLAPRAVAEFSHAPVTLIHYPEAGHYLMLEIPDLSGRDLETFLSNIYGTPLT